MHVLRATATFWKADNTAIEAKIASGEADNGTGATGTDVAVLEIDLKYSEEDLKDATKRLKNIMRMLSVTHQGIPHYDLNLLNCI